VPALAFDASGQGILLHWRANAGTKSQVKSQDMTQVDTALKRLPLADVPTAFCQAQKLGLLWLLAAGKQ
jgi:hypothetical protein